MVDTACLVDLKETLVIIFPDRDYALCNYHDDIPIQAATLTALMKKIRYADTVLLYRAGPNRLFKVVKYRYTLTKDDYRGDIATLRKQFPTLRALGHRWMTISADDVAALEFYWRLV